MNRQTGIMLILITIIVFILWMAGCRETRLKEENNLLKAANDTLVKKRNPDGTQDSKIALLQADNISLLFELETKDSTILWLKEEAKRQKSKIKDGGSVAVVGVSTTYSSTVPTTVLISQGDSCNTYKAVSHPDSTWVAWDSESNCKETRLHLKVKNKFSVTIGSERIGLFKRKPIVDVRSWNPYSDVQELRAFEVKQNKRRWTLGLQAGYGAIVMPKIQTGVFIGIGLTYKLLEL